MPELSGCESRIGRNNVYGRYSFSAPPPVGLRPLRDPDYVDAPDGKAVTLNEQHYRVSEHGSGPQSRLASLD